MTRVLYSEEQGKKMEKKVALDAQPEDTNGRCGNEWFGKLFHVRAAETGKARSPTLHSRVRPTISDEDEAEV